MAISSVTATLGVDLEPRIQTTRSFEAPNPKRFVIARNTSTQSDGTRVTTILYSDKTSQIKTEKPIKASVILKITPGTGGILV